MLLDTWKLLKTVPTVFACTWLVNDSKPILLSSSWWCVCFSFKNSQCTFVHLFKFSTSTLTAEEPGLRAIVGMGKDGMQNRCSLLIQNGESLSYAWARQFTERLFRKLCPHACFSNFSLSSIVTPSISEYSVMGILGFFSYHLSTRDRSWICWISKDRTDFLI